MSGATAEFLGTWSKFARAAALEKRGPYHLAGDEQVLKLPHTLSDWKTYSTGTHLKKGAESQLHLGLLPQPFMGPVKTAKIFILTLNPGLSPLDYFAEYTSKDYRQALLRTMETGAEPHIGLRPEFSWTGAFRYWFARLSPVIERLSKSDDWSVAETIRYMSRSVWTLELVPYHSGSSPSPRAKSLPSTNMARTFVQESLLPRAKRDGLLIVVVRAASDWGLRSDRRAIDSSKTRVVTFSMEKSQGGPAILQALLAPR